jgi:hypothetical protein
VRTEATRAAGRGEKLLVLSSVGALVFASATLVADWIVGPCLVWAVGADLEVVPRIDFAVPLLLQAGCLYAVGRAARPLTRPYGPLSWWWRAVLWNPVPALVALAIITVASGVDKRPGPPLYRLLGTDASNLLWIAVTMLTALLPIAQALALGRRGSLPAERPPR